MSPDLRLVVLMLAGGASVALATSAADTAPSSSSEAAPQRFLCKVFRTGLDATVDTRDRGTEAGRWVLEQEARGWQVASVDFEVGQKPTGFAESYVQVCLNPTMARPVIQSEPSASPEGAADPQP